MNDVKRFPTFWAALAAGMCPASRQHLPIRSHVNSCSYKHMVPLTTIIDVDAVPLRFAYLTGRVAGWWCRQRFQLKNDGRSSQNELDCFVWKNEVVARHKEWIYAKTRLFYDYSACTHVIRTWSPWFHGFFACMRVLFHTVEACTKSTKYSTERRGSTLRVKQAHERTCWVLFTFEALRTYNHEFAMRIFAPVAIHFV